MLKILRSFRGDAPIENWDPPEFEITRATGRYKLKRADSPCVGHGIMAFGRRAVEALTPILQDNGELLPARCNEGELWLYRPKSCDALDWSSPKLVYFDETGMTRFTFAPGAVQNLGIFRLKNYRTTPNFVTQRFVDLWQEAGLRGMHFFEVWAGDEESVAAKPH